MITVFSAYAAAYLLLIFPANRIRRFSFPVARYNIISIMTYISRISRSSVRTAGTSGSSMSRIRIAGRIVHLPNTALPVVENARISNRFPSACIRIVCQMQPVAL